MWAVDVNGSPHHKPVYHGFPWKQSQKIEIQSDNTLIKQPVLSLSSFNMEYSISFTGVSYRRSTNYFFAMILLKLQRAWFAKSKLILSPPLPPPPSTPVRLLCWVAFPSSYFFDFSYETTEENPVPRHGRLCEIKTLAIIRPPTFMAVKKMQYTLCRIKKINEKQLLPFNK